MLVVEVADTTVEFDREVKILMYARSGISEVWLVNINEQLIEVYRQPTSNGYGDVQQFQRSQSVFVQAFSDIRGCLKSVISC